MAAKAEALRVLHAGTRTPRQTRAFFEGIRRWARNGQLGASNYVEMGRYTGGRI